MLLNIQHFWHIMCKMVHISKQTILPTERNPSYVVREADSCQQSIRFHQIAMRGFLVIPVYNEQIVCSSIIRVRGCERVHKGLAVVWEVMEKPKSGTTRQQALHPKRMEFQAAPL